MRNSTRLYMRFALMIGQIGITTMINGTVTVKMMIMMIEMKTMHGMKKKSRCRCPKTH